MRSMLCYLVSLAVLLLSSCGHDDGTVTSTTYSLKSKNVTDHAKSVVVFVHGVMGDAHDTWRPVSSSSGWPELIAGDPALGGIDALSLGYRSSPLGGGSNIEELATRVMTQLRDSGLFTHYDNIFFIAHSMGGLVTKRMLVQLRVADAAAFSHVKGVLFISTPAAGADMAQWASWLSANPQFRDMRPEEFNTLLQTLEDEWIQLLHARTPDHPYPKSFCVYETLRVGIVSVVPRARAQSGCDEIPVAFDRDHSNIVKPTSNTDEVYTYARQRILDSINGSDEPQKIELEFLDQSNNRLPIDAFLRSGDQYSILVRLTKPAWLYVFNRDGKDVVRRYFPASFTGSGFEPVKQVRIPTSDQLRITLDGNTGTERFYVFALTERDSYLESIVPEATSAKTLSKPSQRDVIRNLDSRIALRGGTIGALNPTANVPGEIPAFLKNAGAIFTLEHR